MSKKIFLISFLLFLVLFSISSKTYFGNVSFNIASSTLLTTEYLTTSEKISQDITSMGVNFEGRVTQYFASFLDSKLSLGANLALGFNKPYFVKETSLYDISKLNLAMFYIHPSFVTLYSFNKLSIFTALGLGYKYTARYTEFNNGNVENLKIYQMQLFTDIGLSWNFYSDINLVTGLQVGGNIYSSISNVKNGRWSETFFKLYVGLGYRYSFTTN